MADTKTLTKLRDGYQKKADYYWYCYQADGQARQLRAHERNEELADALTDAINAQATAEELAILKMDVMALRPDDERGDLELAVRRLQKRVGEGRI